MRRQARGAAPATARAACVRQGRSHTVLDSPSWEPVHVINELATTSGSPISSARMFEGRASAARAAAAARCSSSQRARLRPRRARCAREALSAHGPLRCRRARCARTAMRRAAVCSSSSLSPALRPDQGARRDAAPRARSPLDGAEGGGSRPETPRTIGARGRAGRPSGGIRALGHAIDEPSALHAENQIERLSGAWIRRSPGSDDGEGLGECRATQSRRVLVRVPARAASPRGAQYLPIARGVAAHAARPCTSLSSTTASTPTRARARAAYRRRGRRGARDARTRARARARLGAMLHLAPARRAARRRRARALFRR